MSSSRLWRARITSRPGKRRFPKKYGLHFRFPGGFWTGLAVRGLCPERLFPAFPSPRFPEGRGLDFGSRTALLLSDCTLRIGLRPKPPLAIPPPESRALGLVAGPRRGAGGAKNREVARKRKRLPLAERHKRARRPANLLARRLLLDAMRLSRLAGCPS